MRRTALVLGLIAIFAVAAPAYAAGGGNVWKAIHALQGQVAGLKASDSQQSARLATLEGQVATLQATVAQQGAQLSCMGGVLDMRTMHLRNVSPFSNYGKRILRLPGRFQRANIHVVRFTC